MRRLDKGFAQIAGLICTAAGIKTKAGDVLTEADFAWSTYEEPDATPEQMVAELMKGPRNG